MAFWKNVALELDYRGMSRKELSFRSGVSLAVISKGMQRDSDVSAEAALRISSVLGVSMEQLLGISEALEKEGKEKGLEPLTRAETLLFRKYQACIQHLEALPLEEKNLALKLVSILGKRVSCGADA